MSCLNDSDFHRFPSLPVEIRLMVWEYTWPMPRVIEAVSFEVFDDDDYEEFTILRPAGSVSKFSNHRFEWRILESKPLESCPHPVALGVCHESREHTLKHFLAMEHSKSDAVCSSFVHFMICFGLVLTSPTKRSAYKTWFIFMATNSSVSRLSLFVKMIGSLILQMGICPIIFPQWDHWRRSILSTMSLMTTMNW